MIKVVLEIPVPQQVLNELLKRYIVYLFSFEKLAYCTIKTYLAGLQRHLFLSDAGVSVWSPPIPQILKGFFRVESVERPLSLRHKLPFTRSMVESSRRLILDRLPVFEGLAIYAALCMGLMFLFRKSEFLTDSNRKPKVTSGVVVTLLASNVHFWYGSTPYAACDPLLPSSPPDLLSMYLPLSKGDPYGKGATRFFPIALTNPLCMVSYVHSYAFQAKLRANDCFFAGPRYVVSSSMISIVLKTTAHALGIPADRISCHSLRVGGLVVLFAADVPDSLKQLAGRWASAESFITYARATLEQYATIANALNNPTLVTAEQVKMFYSSPMRSC